jgi:hypothetical protein
MRPPRPAAAAALTALVISLAAGTAAAEPAERSHRPARPVVVVSGLNNPRQLSLTRAGELLIAEAGVGGTLAGYDDPERGPQGIGETGSVSAVRSPAVAAGTAPHRIVTGLLSAAGPDGLAAVGADGVSADNLGTISIQLTRLPAAAVPPRDAPANGRLLRATGRSGNIRPVADIAGYEFQHNPDGQDVYSDPYAVLQRRHDVLVADAGGNDVLRVDRQGRISTFAVLPNVVSDSCLVQQAAGCQFVPAALAADRQGNVYVGGLAGLVPDQGTVVEFSPDGTRVLASWTGFSGVSGLAVDDVGTLYVSQLLRPEVAPRQPGLLGVLTRLTRDGRRTDLDVPFPAGVATDNRGNVYVAAFSTAPGTGLPDGSGRPIPGTSGQIWRVHW